MRMTLQQLSAISNENSIEMIKDDHHIEPGSDHSHEKVIDVGPADNPSQSTDVENSNTVLPVVAAKDENVDETRRQFNKSSVVFDTSTSSMKTPVESQRMSSNFPAATNQGISDRRQQFNKTSAVFGASTSAIKSPVSLSQYDDASNKTTIPRAASERQMMKLKKSFPVYGVSATTAKFNNH